MRTLWTCGGVARALNLKSKLVLFLAMEEKGKISWAKLNKALNTTEHLLQHLPGKIPGFICRRCKNNEVDLFWVCPSCGAFESAVSIVSGITATQTDDIPGDALVEQISDWLPRKMREKSKKIQTGN